MKNRILWITLAMILGLSACSNSEATGSQTEDEQPEKEENKKEDKDTVSLKELITDNRDNAWKRGI